MIVEATFGSTSKLISKETTSKAWKWGDEAIMKVINESWYQLSNKVSSETSNKVEEKEKQKQDEKNNIKMIL